MQRYPKQQKIWLNTEIPSHTYIPAYIVISEPWQDLHRHAIFLSPNFGLFSAFLYGAMSKRNHLRGTVQAFSFGKLNVKRGTKTNTALTRLQVVDWQIEAPSLILSPIQNIEIYEHISLWSELLLYSHGQGQINRPLQQQATGESLLFAELRSLLSCILSFNSSTHCRLATLRFFWQFLLLEGFRPSLERCHHCNRRLVLRESEVFFSTQCQLLCVPCAMGRSGHSLSMEELNLLCWAEQDLSTFVCQHELFFGTQADQMEQVASALLRCLHLSLEELFGRTLGTPKFCFG